MISTPLSAMDFQEYGIGTRKSTVPTQLAKASNFDYDSPIMLEKIQTSRIECSTRPDGGLSETGPYTFILPSHPDSYLLLANVGLYCQAKIVQRDGTDIAAADTLAPVNMLGSAMWERVEVLLNGYEMHPASTTDTHYKSYIETLLSYDETARETHLRAQAFALDTAGEFDTMTIGADARNKGFRERYGVSSGSKVFDLFSPITCDFLRANNNLAPGNTLTLRLYRAADRFVINGKNLSKFYKLQIVDLQLFYQRVRVRENVAVPLTDRYLITRTEMKHHPITANSTDKTLSIFKGDRMPKSIIIAQVKTTAYQGTYAENGFYLANYDLKRINLKVNGVMVPSDPLRPNFDREKPLVNREFIHLFMNTGSYRQNRGNCIGKLGRVLQLYAPYSHINQSTHEFPDFIDGSTIFPFDLNPDLCNGIDILYNAYLYLY